MAEEGITARTGRPFSLPGLREILQNPVYCAADRDAWDYFAALGADLCFPRADCDGRRGLLAYQKRDYTGGRSPRNPVDRWIIALGRHPALVSGATWRAVQELLTPDRAPAVHNRRALLSGLLFCARCGEKLLPKARKGGSYDYICRAKLRRGAAACSCPNLSGAAADQAALDALSAQFPRLAPRLEELAREEQRAACRILLQRADWDGADLGPRPDTAAMERLLGSHASDAAGVAVRLAWQAGLLRDEITNLTWDQVDFERNQLQLPARTIPITQMLADYLRSVYRKWTFLTGNSTNNCVICSDRYHKQMQPQAISRIARRVLDEVGQNHIPLDFPAA